MTRVLEQPFRDWNRYFVDQMFVRWYGLLAEPWQRRDVFHGFKKSLGAVVLKSLDTNFAGKKVHLEEKFLQWPLVYLKTIGSVPGNVDMTLVSSGIGVGELETASSVYRSFNKIYEFFRIQSKKSPARENIFTKPFQYDYGFSIAASKINSPFEDSGN